jgi:hypothetical protein
LCRRAHFIHRATDVIALVISSSECAACAVDGDPALEQDPPLMVTDLSRSLACPSIPHFFTVRIGTSLTCKEIPPEDHTVGGTAGQTETVTFRRIG